MSDDPTPAEVLMACETLLRAGYTGEALAVMQTLPLVRLDETRKAMLQASLRGLRERAALEREDRHG